MKSILLFCPLLLIYQGCGSNCESFNGHVDAHDFKSLRPEGTFVSDSITLSFSNENKSTLKIQSSNTEVEVEYEVIPGGEMTIEKRVYE